MMKSMLLVFMGSGIGGCTRYLITLFVRQYSMATAFPWASFSANLLACALAGFLAGRLLPQEESSRMLWLTGFCGGFSTFSAFSMESIQLFRDGFWLTALIYILLSIAAGMAAFLIFYRNT
jgi:CrcB protein